MPAAATGEFRHIYYSLGEERAKLAGLTFVLGKVSELPPGQHPSSSGNARAPSPIAAPISPAARRTTPALKPSPAGSPGLNLCPGLIFYHKHTKTQSHLIPSE